MTKIAKLCLNMIVRNEMANLERCLGAVAGYVDCWVIGDTGSTDGTQDYIRAFFESRGIPGELHSFPFINFEQARNEALDHAYASPLDYDYLLLTDADMELVVEDHDFRDRLEAPCYDLVQRSGITYWNARIVHRNAGACYHGVTHEYLAVPGGGRQLHGVWYKDHATGANRVDKFERDIRLLLEGLEAEPENRRYWFYLAQSYKDAGRLKEAAETYAKRAGMGGWAEEVWNARLWEARCLLTLGDEDGFLRAAREACDQRPERAEPLYDLAKFYRERGMHDASVLHSEAGLALARPGPDAPFLEDFVYATGLLEEFSISANYSRDHARRDRGFAACDLLALSRVAPKGSRELARHNLRFYVKPASGMMPSFKAHSVAFTPPEGFRALNPSVARQGGQLVMVQRCVNYVVTDSRYAAADGGPIKTRNFLLGLDEELKTQLTAEIHPPRDMPAPLSQRVQGFEDARLFLWRNALWFSACFREMNSAGMAEQVLARIDVGEYGEYRLTDLRVLHPDGPRQTQKNWMPRVTGDRLHFVYLCDPTRIVDEHGQTVTEMVPSIAAKQFRGGSQAIPFDGGSLALIHEVGISNRGRLYHHRFIWLDGSGTLHRVSRPFYFEHHGIEYAAGCAWHPDERRLVISYGVQDREARIAVVDADEVRCILDDLTRSASGVLPPMPGSEPSEGWTAGAFAASVITTPENEPRTPPLIFIHSSWRTSSTWFFGKFRPLHETLCFYEPFNEDLLTITREKASSAGYDSWDSRHPPGDPYYREYLPFISGSGGTQLFEPAIPFDWFIPSGGLRGELRPGERQYLLSLVRHAERVRKIPVFGDTRSLGRVWAIRNVFAGYHIFLHRNLWKQWLSYLYYRRDGYNYLYHTVTRLTARVDDPYLDYLSAYHANKADEPPPHRRQENSTGQHDPERLRLLRTLPESAIFEIFICLHIYLYLNAELVADLTIDVTKMAREASYRSSVEQELRRVTGLPVSLSDVTDTQVLSQPDVDYTAINWDEIKEHARVAVGMLAEFGDQTQLTKTANEFIDAAFTEMRRGRAAKSPPVPGVAARDHENNDMKAAGQTICLAMIVKNEATVIRRCLDSVRPIIDYWVIVDTGSTDGTQDIIREHLKDLPGELHERPWRDFAHNRSEALTLARPHAANTLIIDADDTLEIPEGFHMPELTADSYMLDIHDSSINYQRTQVVRNTLPWCYKGVLHEFLTCDGSGPAGHLPIIMRRGHDGARRKDSKTYYRDAEVLERALATETDPFLISRYTFYLAQSYRDCEEKEKALKYYLARAELGYWQDEVFVALLQVARMKDALDYPDLEVIDAFVRAANALPTRAEAWHGASRYCRSLDRFQEGFEFARRGLEIACPEGGLFVETWVYEYGLLDELAVNGYWSGHYQECLDASERLLASEKCPPEHRERFAANANFARQKLADGAARAADRATASEPVAADQADRYPVSTWVPDRAQGGTELMVEGLWGRLGDALDAIDLRINSFDPADLTGKPLAVWIHHNFDQSFVQWCHDKSLVALVRSFVFVSNWQMDRYIEEFGIPRDKCVVLRNATTIDGPLRVWRPGNVCRVAYVSTPFRGLDVLLDAWDRLKPVNAELHIWSSRKLYGKMEDDGPYETLFARASTLPNVFYRGIVPNDQLREELRGIDYLAYPSTFVETSCLSVIEAMVAGCRVICPDLGALRETTGQFARLYPFPSDPVEHTKLFTDILAEEIRDPWGGNTNQAESQQNWARDTYDWSGRINEWRTFIEGLTAPQFIDTQVTDMELGGYNAKSEMQIAAAPFVTLDSSGGEPRHGSTVQSVQAASRPVKIPRRQTICLCMIVKDEASVIQHCLESVRPVIDYWIIADTGSTDGTQDIITNYLLDIPGELHQRPWVHFAHNRCEALNLARNHADYTLIIDADDALEISPGFKMPFLNADSYTVEILYGKFRYWRPHLIHNRLPWRYEGVLHEFLSCDPDGNGSRILPETRSQKRLPGLKILIGEGGARRQMSVTDRFLRDAKVLEDALATETDPFLIARYKFYLAQSLRDAGEKRRAIEVYLERSKLGGWEQEVFISLYYTANLKASLDFEADDVIATYLRAHAAVPERAEALHGAARFCRLKDRFQQGYDLAKRALKIRRPDKGLFLEAWIYDHGLLDELAVSAYWTGRYSECLATCRKILALRDIPEDLRQRVQANADFARQNL